VLLAAIDKKIGYKKKKARLFSAPVPLRLLCPCLLHALLVAIGPPSSNGVHAEEEPSCRARFTIKNLSHQP
jgi:hypothetical protein